MSTAESTRKYKIIIGILSAAVVILSVLLIITKTRVNTFIIEKERAVSERMGMQNQLDSLLLEHEKIRSEYGNLTAELASKDSLILAQAEEIQKLIASNAGKHQIQRKLDYLRGITQDYVAQIDKLLTENKALKEEIQGTKDELKSQHEKNLALNKDKDELKEQINKAAVLQAYSVVAQGVQIRQGGKKEEVTDKAKKLDKIKISFTIGKNSLAEAGPKNIYVRIARPDNQIINDGQSFAFEGKDIMYSLMQTINYQNKPVSLSLYYEKSDRIIPGTYHIAIFADGFEIGATQLTLK